MSESGGGCFPRVCVCVLVYKAEEWMLFWYPKSGEGDVRKLTRTCTAARSYIELFSPIWILIKLGHSRPHSTPRARSLSYFLNILLLLLLLTTTWICVSVRLCVCLLLLAHANVCPPPPPPPPTPIRSFSQPTFIPLLYSTRYYSSYTEWKKELVFHKKMYVCVWKF